ncbi:hypothetical protein KM92DES2_10194 [uncultured Desulfovibrio sp.]|uniref:Uncharacterized protein n=1 Tax=uncultured Desulfovibrio sp. TaxID=167968 RepID=A0A212IXJ1_9BACT|nr:hypothetical protein KM92DES2_10194 [uncultured Desulfovibrio sp.]
MLCAEAGQTPAEALLFAQDQTGLARIAPGQFAREEAALPHQTDHLQLGQVRIVQVRIVPGAGVLPQAQRGWWHRLLEVCGMQNLSCQRLVSGSQGPEPLFGMARQGLAQRVWQPERLALPQALASRQAVDVALRE